MLRSPLLADPLRLITSPWQRPKPPLTIDWSRAPRGLDTFVVFEGTHPVELVQDRKFTYGANVADAPTPIGCGFSWTQADQTTKLYYTPIAPLFTGGSQPASFEAYFYWTSLSGPVIGLHDGTPMGGTMDRILGIGTTNGGAWYIFDGTSNIINSSALSPGLQHLVGVCDGSSTKLYVNGALAASAGAANSGFVPYTAPQFCIGSQNAAANPNFNQVITATLLHCGFATVAWAADEVMDRYLNMYEFLVPVEGDFSIMLPPAPPPMMGQIWI